MAALLYGQTNTTNTNSNIIIFPGVNYNKTDDADAIFSFVPQIAKQKAHRTTADRSNPYTSRGVKKAKAADPIRSIDDFRAIQNYFLSGKPNYRNYMLITLGCIMGIRAGDLLSLHIRDVYDVETNSCRERIEIFEQKTGDFNNALIPNAAKDAIELYLASLDTINPDNYLFYSQRENKNGEHVLGVDSTNTIFYKAKSDLNLKFHFSTHSMRKTFAYHTIQTQKDIDPNIMSELQMMLNHDDIRTTYAYSGCLLDRVNEIRNDVANVLCQA